MMQKQQRLPQQGLFLTGPTMGHVVRMTLTGATGITFVFLVDLANLFWVSRIGDPKLVAAIGYAFAIQFFSVSSGIGLMIGTTALVSRNIGMGQPATARHMATSAMLITLLFQALAALLVVGFRYPLLEMVGAAGDTLEHAARYLAITIPSLVIMAVGLVASAVLRAVGDGKRAMFVTLTSGAVSVMIDPILILTFGLGLDGAAIALVISRFILAGMALRFAVGTHDLFAWPAWASVRAALRPFAVIAIPAMLTQLSTPFGNYLLTGVVSGFGDDAVAAWAVVNRLTVVAFGGIFALSGAIGGIFGQNYGAQRFDRLRSTFRDSLIFCTLYTLVAWVLLATTAGLVIDGFGLRGEGVAVYLAFARVGSGAFVLVGAMFVSNAAFNNIGRPTRSTLLNWFRDGVLTLPAALFGAAWFGATGVIYAQYSVGAVAGVLAALWAHRYLRGLGGVSAGIDGGVDGGIGPQP